MDVLSLIIGIVSLVVGIVSIVLAIVAMDSSKKAEQQSLHNFEKTQDLLTQNYEATQKMLHDNYEKTKELLAEIDKKAAVIDSVVQRNQEQMMSTITNIVNETVIPKKRDLGEEIGAQFVMGLLSNPEQAQASLNNLGALADLMQKYPSQKKSD